MRNIDFSDIHKFVVSIGLVLIFLAILIPWLFFKEKFDLLLNVSEIKQMTEAAQDLINYRQQVLLITVKFLPYLSITMFIVGVILVIFGLIKWNKKQIIFDEHQVILLSKTKKEIESMSYVEKSKSVLEESNQDYGIGMDNSVESPETFNKYKSQQIIISKYLDIESNILKSVEKSYSIHYGILSNMRVGNLEYDIILNSNSGKDVILEIKYLKNINSILNFNKSIIALKNLKLNYSHILNKKVIAKILIVLPNTLYNKVTTNKNIMEKISKFDSEIVLINENTLDNLKGDFLGLLSDSI